MSLRDSLQIMVVDDMAVSRALIEQSLNEMGVMHVSAENDARAAFGKLTTAPVHLVISDMNMPGMNGLQLLESLRNNRSTQRIGFILITGTPSAEVLKRGQELGANNMVKKPFTTATLRDSIERVVGRL